MFFGIRYQSKQIDSKVVNKHISEKVIIWHSDRVWSRLLASACVLTIAFDKNDWS